MRQRAALLRTVVQDRPVLLLDEPFGALDSLTRTDMQTWLAGVRDRFDWTVLLITHDIREAVFLSDRVVVLGPRPTRVRREVTVDLPQPRELDMLASPRFTSIEVELLDALRVGTVGTSALPAHDRTALISHSTPAGTHRARRR